VYFFLGALKRYFLSKKQESSLQQKDKFEEQKRKRVVYERKKEVCYMVPWNFSPLHSVSGERKGQNQTKLTIDYQIESTVYNRLFELPLKAAFLFFNWWIITKRKLYQVTLYRIA
jgi:hypothetical protein